MTLRIDAVTAALVLTLAGAAHAASVTVQSTDDIFLASQPSGTSVSGFFGTDTAPGGSPVMLNVFAGDVLTFSASGSTTVDGSCFAGADGGCYADESGFSPSPASNTYKGPAGALIGVFLATGVTSVENGLHSLDFTQAGNQGLLSQSPSLNQIFYIGDGLTGTGFGSIQSFHAPTGAFGLYLASADSFGASFNNSGSLEVNYTQNPGAVGVPEPISWTLMLAGIAGLGVALRGRRRTAAAGIAEVRNPRAVQALICV